MKQQSNGNVTCFLEKQSNEINPHGPIRMQRMKINAAAIWIKNGIGYQVI